MRMRPMGIPLLDAPLHRLIKMKEVPVKVLSLTVRPVFSSDLCFGVAGVIEKQMVQLGEWKEGFDFGIEVAAELKPFMDSVQVDQLYKENILLARLRPQLAAASLDQIVMQRNNSKLTLFNYAQQLQDAYNAVYGASSDSSSRLERLKDLKAQEDSRSSTVATAYGSDWAKKQNIQDAVTETQTSEITNCGTQVTNVYSSGQAAINTADNGTIRGFAASGLYVGGDPDKDPSWQYITTQVPDPAAFGSFTQQQQVVDFPEQKFTSKFVDLRNYRIENLIKNQTTQIGI